MSTTYRTRYKSKYKFVIGLSRGQGQPIKWIFHMKGVSEKRFETEREAAIAADIYLLNIGREPVNLLKRK